MNNFNDLKQKNDLIDHDLFITGREPEPLSKGLFLVALQDHTLDKVVDVTLTRRDIQAIKDAFPQHFTFVKAGEWANIEPIQTR